MPLFNTILILSLFLLNHIGAQSECQTDQFMCVSSGSCIPAASICDGVQHCDDNSDEADCTNPEEGSGSETGADPETTVDPETNGGLNCGVDEFVCAWEGNPVCTPELWRCDGFQDCDDDEDELNCDEDEVTCAEDEFVCTLEGVETCTSNVVEWKCDGANDCDNAEDELNCEETLDEPVPLLAADEAVMEDPKALETAAAKKSPTFIVPMLVILSIVLIVIVIACGVCYLRKKRSTKLVVTDDEDALRTNAQTMQTNVVDMAEIS